MKSARSLPFPARHYGILIMILLVGLGLRFWNLAEKPLWLDETITAVFALGRDYGEVPTGRFLELDAVTQFFTLNPAATCPEIAQRLIRDSSHPPLFFCLLHTWLVWLRPDAEQWVWALRSFSALVGTGAIAALYLLNRLAFSPSAGLMAAGLMAVSPYGVYLSQEARHYTLPMLLISLAMVGTVMLIQDGLLDRTRLWVWLGWIGVNVLGLYVHYFFLLALVAQLVALAVVGWLYRSQVHPRIGLWLVGAIALILLAYRPWIPVLLSHVSRPETEWLGIAPGWGQLAPLYQGLAGWMIMLILLPVEHQPLAIALPLGLIMLGIFGWIMLQATRGLRYFTYQHPAHAGFWAIATITFVILLQYLIIIYGLGKDLTLAPRYNFVYFPGFCALLGLALTWIPPQRIRFSLRHPHRPWRSPYLARYGPMVAIAAGLLSSVLVVNGLGFYKSFDPDLVAAQLLDNSHSTAVAFFYPSPQELALSLSFARGLQQAPGSQQVAVAIAFLPYHPAQTPAWDGIPPLPPTLPLPLNLWSFTAPTAPAFPTELTISVPAHSRVRCLLDPTAQHNSFGTPYQRYHCPLARG